MRIALLILTVVLIGVLQPVSAAVIHVPGDYSTIQTAIDSASYGDTVLVDPGTYVETIDFHGQTVVVGSLFLTTGDTAYISQTIIDGNQDSSVVSFENSEDEGTELVGFSIRNGLGTGDWPNVRGGGINIIGAAAPTIRYCYIYDNSCVGSSNRGGGIYIRSGFNVKVSNCKVWGNTASTGAGIMFDLGSSGSVVDSCRIFDNFGDGMGTNYSSAIAVSRTVISGNSGWGYRSFSTADARVVHCTITGNGSYGFLAQGTGNDTDTLFIVNSIIYANADSFEVANDTLFKATYSIIENGPGHLWFGTGCLDTDPLFANADFELSPNSPAIDAGDPSYPLDPDNTTADMGVHYHDQATGIGDQPNRLPLSFALHQNYPNPFNPETKIEYQLPEKMQAELIVYNVIGEHIRTLVSGEQNPGDHQITWDGKNNSGLQASSGIYFYRLKAGNAVQTKKMILLQ